VSETTGTARPDRSPARGPTEPGFGRLVSVELERTVDAPMQRVWVLLRDYRSARPRLLTGHFAGYAVQRGGDGAGTVIEFGLRVRRRERSYVVAVEEPAPGRQLRERARGSALVTTWTPTPGGEGERTVVWLAVQLRDPDVRGWWARRHARRALRRTYGQLLARLDRNLAAGR
jgi:hypothetical protein